MVIEIGHYNRNITPTEVKNGGIKSLDIIDERGAIFNGMKAREYPKKRGKFRIMAYYSIITQG